MGRPTGRPFAVAGSGKKRRSPGGFCRPADGTAGRGMTVGRVGAGLKLAR
ncbi:hypothetical protein [Azospirillum argentinense]|nr:hypothetical protein [Azospirillum argentinense]